MENVLDIGEVARATGLTLRALRFYEARGLVRPERTGGGRRVYDARALARLNAALALKRAGFSLTQIAAILGDRPVDLRRLVAAQIAELDTRAAEIAEARALLLTVQSRIDRGEPIHVATLCSLIEKGRMMEHENWKAVGDRYLSDEAKTDFAAAADKMCADFDQADYARKWADLSARIEAALPLDPASPAAGAFYDEWQALIAPFFAVATPAMKAGVGAMY
ncbi:MAG: MerR family transcriptional regulator, partial [Pseudomonadota bacterium]|nr:MerR family transcriptional regulator [Pseudomonadota bacterium]